MATRSHEQLIPGRAELCAALRRITEALSAELSSPTASAPDWNPFDWGIARAVVAIHGIAGVLLRDLRWPGAPGWREFLEREVSETRTSHARRQHLLQELDLRAKRERISIVALKGCALHALGLYQPGERPMADVDLLVKTAQFDAVSGLLLAMGFEVRGESWKHREFVQVAGPSTDNEGTAARMLKVDLHSRLAERLAYRDVELPGEPFAGSADPGIQGYPSIAALLSHLLLHTAGNMSTRWVRGIHLHDIARVAGRLTAADWLSIRSTRWSDRWYLYPPMMLTTRYFPGSMDVATLREFESECPSWLARVTGRQLLTDVSASNARLLALPELAWCASLGGLLRYLRLRAIPDRSELDDLRGLARTADYGRGQRWFTMSQPARIATWLFRRPLRPATLNAVQTGLASMHRPLSPNPDNGADRRH